jgi:hypothetical protein
LTVPSEASRKRKEERRQSRAALWTIQLAVDAVADSVHQLKMLRRHMHRGHHAALATLRMARHHSLNASDLSRVEDLVGNYARAADWPATMRSRSRHEHLERPLSATESGVLAGLAGSALAVVAGALTVCEQLATWYGGLAVAAAAAARSARPHVTVEAHQQRANKLLLRLDQLCANDHIAWAFVAAAGSSRPAPDTAARTLH